MKDRSSPRLHLWTPGTVFLGICGAAILQAAPACFGFRGTAASRQHTTILRETAEKHGQRLLAPLMLCPQRRSGKPKTSPSAGQYLVERW